MVSLNHYLIHESLGAYAGISEITNSVYANTQNRQLSNVAHQENCRKLVCP